MNDEQLHRLLREYPAHIRLPDAFGREVWARIEAEDAQTCLESVRRMAEDLFAWLARPLPATVTVLLCAVLGVGLGTVVGRLSLKAGYAEADKLAYVQSINPLDHSALGEPR